MIQVVKGNLFDNVKPNSVVAHCVNCINVIGGGFTAPLIKKWPVVKKKFHQYHDYYKFNNLSQLGECDFVRVQDENIYVANMYGQYETISADNPRPLNYWAIAIAMKEVADFCRDFDPTLSIICPWFGCGLAGGNQEFVRCLMEDIWHDLDVTVYEL